jgi:hypothetical protein
MKITNTQGNRKNGIKGSRVSIYTDAGELVDRFVVPKYWGVKYCKDYPNGKYGKRFFSAIEKAEIKETKLTGKEKLKRLIDDGYRADYESLAWDKFNVECEIDDDGSLWLGQCGRTEDDETTMGFNHQLSDDEIDEFLTWTESVIEA